MLDIDRLVPCPRLVLVMILPVSPSLLLRSGKEMTHQRWVELVLKLAAAP